MTHTRQAKHFAWSTVDPSLTRSLLVAAHQEFGPVEAVAKLEGMSAEDLVRQAERALRRPPTARVRDNRTKASRVLHEQWLPAADDTTLVWLTASANRYDGLPNREERLKFLAGRRRTEAFVKNLWSAFLAAHKVAVSIDSRPGGDQPERMTRLALVGADVPSRHAAPYAHQELAWEGLVRLSGEPGHRSGLVVIPTGGGKTSTLVRWLIGELVRRPDLRVLWIADQQELVDQAVREFGAVAETQPVGFQRLLRPVHGKAGQASALADPDVHVVCTTRQSLIGPSFEARSSLIATFVVGPTVVVVDEAHHAVSPTYQNLIAFLRRECPDLTLIGLTATPWPAGAGQMQLLRETFKTELVSVTTSELVARGDLARPVLHTVTTSTPIEATDDDVRRLASARALPPSVVRQLDREARNALIVRQWVDRKDQWGKTLVFACDTWHADSLGDAFAEAGVDVDVVHSFAEADPAEALARFRTASGPNVLVSVGMLLEGVDVPSARTAFLCRPTASHIVMRQMIGRVLRGVRAGGDPEAHVVDFVDQWDRHVGVLSPVDLPDVQMRQTRPSDGRTERELPPVLADDQTEVGEDLVRAIARAMSDRVQQNGLTAALTGSSLIGFYDLDTRRLPVFAHVAQAWEETASWATAPAATGGTTARAFFDDAPPPVPLDGEVAPFVDYCRSHGTPPPLTPLETSVDVAATARRLIGADAMSEVQRTAFLRDEYESSLFRCFYPDLQRFIEAVEQETLVQLDVIGSGTQPEQIPAPQSPPARSLHPEPDRDLRSLFDATVAEGARLLASDASYDGWLDREWLPAIGWTRHPVTSAWAYWSWRNSTRAKGKPVIRINLALQASPDQVSDDLLKYLIWHELCHHLTPGRGHDAEFRRLERLWLNHDRLDHELDTLHERYQIPTALNK